MEKRMGMSSAAPESAAALWKKIEKALKVLHAAKSESLKKLIEKAPLN